MKKTQLLFVFISLCLNIWAQDEISIKAPITDVKVLLNNAEISRTTTVTIPKGRHTLIFNGISEYLDDNSIRLTINENIDILQINSEKSYLKDKKKTPRIERLQDSLKLIDKQIRQYDDYLNAFSVEKQLLLKNQEIGGQNTGVEINQLKQTAEFYRTRLIEINTKISELNEKKTKDQQTKYRLQKQLDELNATATFPTSIIKITIDASKDISTKIILKYLVANAGWSPVYDIKADEKNTNSINLTYRANVFNNTGIDWKNINLVLSTNNATVSNDLPILTTWFIKEASNVYYQSQNEYVQSKGTPKQEKVYVQQDIAPTQQVPDITDDFQYQASVPMLAYEFIIPKKYTILSDNKPYIVKISENNLNSEFRHYAVTKLDPDVFIVARVSGWQSINLIDGPANVFYNGSFIGKSFISTRNVNDTINFSLGRDSKVLVKRYRLNKYNSTQFIGNKKKVTFEYQYEIKNNHKYEVELVLSDQIPVSQTDQIEVKDVELSGGELDVSTGIVKWKFNLSAGQVKKIKFSYYVKFPKNMTVPLYQSQYQNIRYFQ